jgi:hypothetical protein
MIKRRRVQEEQPIVLPSSMIVQLAQGDVATGPPIDLPLNSSTAQLEELVNTLLANEERVREEWEIIEIEICKFTQHTHTAHIALHSVN